MEYFKWFLNRWGAVVCAGVFVVVFICVMAAWWVHKVTPNLHSSFHAHTKFNLEFGKSFRSSRPVSIVDLQIEKPEGKWPKVVVLIALKTTHEALATFQLVTFNDRRPISKLSDSLIHLLPITISWVKDPASWNPINNRY